MEFKYDNNSGFRDGEISPLNQEMSLGSVSHSS